jgi:site-specific DNA recombinase
MRAIGYIRVSTQGQAEDGVSLDAQESKIRAWAELNDADVLIFRDEGISGKRADNRPGLQAALETIGKGDALLVYSLSRLSRSTKDAIMLSETLQKKDADLVSLSEKIDTTSAAGKMVFRMLAVLSEFERDQVSDRTRFALAHKKANNEKTGGALPFGSELASDGKHLAVNEREREAVGIILELNTRGYSLRAICRELEIRGIETKTGKSKWNPKTISKILKRAA